MACMVSQPFFSFTIQLTSSSVPKFTAVNNTSVLGFPTAFYTLWPLTSHMCFQASFASYSCDYTFYTSNQTHGNITFILTVFWLFLVLYYICLSGLFFISILKTGTVLVLSLSVLSSYNIPTCKCRQPLGNPNKLILFRATQLT